MDPGGGLKAENLITHQQLDDQKQGLLVIFTIKSVKTLARKFNHR